MKEASDDIDKIFREKFADASAQDNLEPWSAVQEKLRRKGFPASPNNHTSLFKYFVFALVFFSFTVLVKDSFKLSKIQVAGEDIVDMGNQEFMYFRKIQTELQTNKIADNIHKPLAGIAAKGSLIAGQKNLPANANGEAIEPAANRKYAKNQRDHQAKSEGNLQSAIFDNDASATKIFAPPSKVNSEVSVPAKNSQITAGVEKTSDHERKNFSDHEMQASPGPQKLTSTKAATEVLIGILSSNNRIDKGDLKSPNSENPANPNLTLKSPLAGMSDTNEHHTHLKKNVNETASFNSVKEKKSYRLLESIALKNSADSSVNVETTKSNFELTQTDEIKKSESSEYPFLPSDSALTLQKIKKEEILDSLIEKKYNTDSSSVASNKQQKKSNHFFPGISVGLFVMPGLSQVHNYESVGGLSRERKFNDGNFHGILDAGISINFHLGKRFTIGTGIITSSFSQKLLVSETHTYRDTIYKQIYNPAVSSIPVVLNDQTLFNPASSLVKASEIPESLFPNEYQFKDSLYKSKTYKTTKYQYVGIPLLAGVEFGSAKLQVVVNSGILMNIPVSKTSTMDIKYDSTGVYPGSQKYVQSSTENSATYTTFSTAQNSPFATRAVSSIKELANLNWMFFGGVNLKYSLGNSLSLTVGPALRYSLNSAFGKNESVKALPYSWTLQLGISYRIR